VSKRARRALGVRRDYCQFRTHVRLVMKGQRAMQGTVYASGLPSSFTQQQLTLLFGERARVPTRRTWRGCAVRATYTSPLHAADAYGPTELGFMGEDSTSMCKAAFVTFDSLVRVACVCGAVA
jgi:hypothetical protein